MTAPDPDLPSVPVRQVGPYTWSVLPPPFDPAETARLRTRVAALEAECAALADALGEHRHEFEPGEGRFAEMCWHKEQIHPDWPDWTRCGHSAVASVHRTPAVVRAELENGAP